MENKKAKVFDFRKFMKNEKAVKTVIFGGLALLALVFLADLFSPQANREKTSANSVNSAIVDFHEYEKHIEEKLAQAISAIDGVGKSDLTIVVTIDSLCETVYSERGNGIRTVVTPKVRGVAVVCPAGGDIITKGKIIEVVSRTLGISTTKISVTN
jgi:hypothetical protein